MMLHLGAEKTKAEMRRLEAIPREWRGQGQVLAVGEEDKVTAGSFMVLLTTVTFTDVSYIVHTCPKCACTF